MDALMPHAPRTASACGRRARAAKIPEGFLNESPKKFVWRPATNYQLKIRKDTKKIFRSIKNLKIRISKPIILI